MAPWYYVLHCLTILSLSTLLSISILKSILHFVCDRTPLAWSPANHGEQNPNHYPMVKHFTSSLTSGHATASRPLEDKCPSVTSDSVFFPWLLAHFPWPCSPLCPQSSYTCRPTGIPQHIRSNDSKYWQEAGSPNPKVSTQRQGINRMSNGLDFTSHPCPCLLPHTSQRSITVLCKLNWGEKKSFPLRVNSFLQRKIKH